nr:protein NDRG3-like [Pelodiscus sinensis]|eukprot:XP_014429705.1 protein NDRG3-like [Pelodiscus sinensis]
MDELQDVQLTEIKPLLHDKNAAQNFQDFDCQEHDIETASGVIHVTLRGTPKGNRPVILTYHDIGLNRKSSCSKDWLPLPPASVGDKPSAQASCCEAWLGQGSGAGVSVFSDCVCFSLRSIVGIGVGAGAYILSRFALNHPDLVEGLVLINVDPCARGWMDWAAAKFSGWTTNIVDIVLAHHFGQEELQANLDLIQTYRLHIAQDINPENLQLFLASYNRYRAVPGRDVHLRAALGPCASRGARCAGANVTRGENGSVQGALKFLVCSDSPSLALCAHGPGLLDLVVCWCLQGPGPQGGGVSPISRHSAVPALERA